MTPVDGNLLLKEANFSDVKVLVDLALKEQDTNNFHLALNYVIKAIEIYPTENLTATERSNFSKLSEIAAKM